MIFTILYLAKCVNVYLVKCVSKMTFKDYPHSEIKYDLIKKILYKKYKMSYKMSLKSLLMIFFLYRNKKYIHIKALRK